MYIEMVYRQLLVLHKTDGGYYGTDIAEIARENNVSVTSMQVNFCRWRATDKRFACLNYLGRQDVTLKFPSSDTLNILIVSCR